MQDRGEWDRGNCLLRASIKVKGMETERRRSDSARLNMKMFLAVLISFLFRTADITRVFPITENNEYLAGLNWGPLSVN